jgi:hypothetical protein
MSSSETSLTAPPRDAGVIDDVRDAPVKANEFSAKARISASSATLTRCVITFRFGFSISFSVSASASAFTSEMAIPAIGSCARRIASAPDAGSGARLLQ